MAEENKTQEMNLDECMLQAQKEILTVGKGSKGYGYNYADLPTLLRTVKPILNKYGIELKYSGNAGPEVVEQYPVFKKGDEVVEGVHVALPVNLNANNVAQEIGSLMTYGQRYSLTASLALEVDDDDAETAQRKTRTEQPQVIAHSRKMLNDINNKVNEVSHEAGKKPQEIGAELTQKMGVKDIKQLPVSRFDDVMNILNNWEA